MPGKTVFAGVQRNAGRFASMGPRQDAGEDLFPGRVTARGSARLQWGPGRMPGKTI